MKCFYHNDLDGHAAAAVVKLVCPEVECFHVDYKDDFPFQLIEPHEHVWIVDFSMQKPEEWERLLGITQSVIWIDHHESAIKKATGTQAENLPGLRDTGACGALHTWNFLNAELIGMGFSFLPQALAWVDKWDRWLHNEEPAILNFVAGMELANRMSPGSTTWNGLFSKQSDILEAVTKDGSIARQSKEADSRSYFNAFGHEFSWRGYRCCALNRGKLNSLVFGDRIKEFDICIAFVWDGKIWAVSLYSERVKVNDIAVQFGGGGHPGAAGFQCLELPWLKVEKTE